MGKASSRKKQSAVHDSVHSSVIRESAFRAFPWWILCTLCLVAFFSFAQTLAFDFVYDDDIQVLRNPWIRDWSQVGKFFFVDVWSYRNGNQPGNYYRPLHMLAHAVGYAISGLKPQGYHLINVLLHCLSTLLVALLGYRLTRNRTASAAGGFLFALHPVHAESIAWIAGITDPLCAVFYFGALSIYFDSDHSTTWKTVVMGALLFLGALFSKEMAFMLPLVVLWLDVCLGRKLHWNRYAALVASFGIYAGFRIHALSHFQNDQVPIDLDFGSRVLSSIVLLGEYIAKAFVPFNINAFHVFHPTTSIGDLRSISAILMILVYAGAAWLLRNDRKVLFLFGFIFISLIPVLNISGIGENVFADRYLYIPSFASCLLIPLLVQKVVKRKPSISGISEERIVLGFSAAVCVIFAFLLYGTAGMWRNNRILYTETIKRSPDSVIIANNLSDNYFQAGQMKEAEFWSLRAEESWNRSYIKPPQRLVELYVRLSSISVYKGNLQEALTFLKKAEQIDPDSDSVLQNLAGILIMKGDYAAARTACERAIAINPQTEVAHNNMAYILLRSNEIDQAIEHARKAIEIFPKYADAYLNLARGYAAKGLSAQSADAYRKAKLINPALQPVVDKEMSLVK